MREERDTLLIVPGPVRITETERPLTSTAFLSSFFIHSFNTPNLFYYVRVSVTLSHTASLSNTLYAFVPSVLLFTPISFPAFLVLFHSYFITIISFQLVLFNDPIQ